MVAIRIAAAAKAQAACILFPNMEIYFSCLGQVGASLEKRGQSEASTDWHEPDLDAVQGLCLSSPWP